jgi:GNAT acetyltransferase-like protein
MQLELECKQRTEQDRLVRIAGDEPDDIERVQLTRLGDGACRVLIRDDVDERLVSELRKLDPQMVFDRPKLVAELLGGTMWKVGLSYTFPTDLAPPGGVVREMPESAEPDEPWMHRPQFAVYVDGVRVSYCRSSRENARSAEAWVETNPENRRQGHARAAVAAWACAIRASGKVPFYSHDAYNVASAGVARSLGLHQWLTWINFEDT